MKDEKEMVSYIPKLDTLNIKSVIKSVDYNTNGLSEEEKIDLESLVFSENLKIGYIALQNRNKELENMNEQLEQHCDIFKEENEELKLKLKNNKFGIFNTIDSTGIIKIGDLECNVYIGNVEVNKICEGNTHRDEHGCLRIDNFQSKRKFTLIEM